jgi:hypothetical protein
LLLNATAQSGWNVIVGEWTTLTVVTVLGAVIGWLRGLDQQLKRELAECKRMERNVQESEIRFRRLLRQHAMEYCCSMPTRDKSQR